MFEKYFQRFTRDDEFIVIMIQSHWLHHFGRSLFGFLFLLLPFFLLFPSFRYHELGILGFSLLLACALFYNIRLVTIRSLNRWIVSNERIIDVDQHGLFRRTVSEIDFAKIQDIRYHRVGLLATFFNIGNIAVASDQKTIELHGVKNPHEVKEAIFEAQKKFSIRNRGDQPLTAEELVSFIDRLKQLMIRKIEK